MALTTLIQCQCCADDGLTEGALNIRQSDDFDPNALMLTSSDTRFIVHHNHQHHHARAKDKSQGRRLGRMVVL